MNRLKLTKRDLTNTLVKIRGSKRRLSIFTGRL